MKLYQKVMSYVSDRIDSGEWPVGYKIPTEQEIMDIVGASRMTVHRALRELASGGRLDRKSGVGSFVTATRSYLAVFEIKSIATEIHERGGHHSAKVLVQREVQATKNVAADGSVVNFVLRGHSDGKRRFPTWPYRRKYWISFYRIAMRPMFSPRMVCLTSLRRRCRSGY